MKIDFALALVSGKNGSSSNGVKTLMLLNCKELSGSSGSSSSSRIDRKMKK